MNATASNRDKNTGRWAEVGAPRWISATFWGDEARYLSTVLSKGDRVSVEGTLVLETLHRRHGSEGLRYVFRSHRFLGVIPPRKTEAQEPNPRIDTGSIPMGYQGHAAGAAEEHSGAPGVAPGAVGGSTGPASGGVGPASGGPYKESTPF